MNITHNPPPVRNAENRLRLQVTETVEEALAWALRQIDHERERKDAFVKYAQSELKASEARISELLRRVEELRSTIASVERVAA